jgi:hypothetical protein
MEFSLRVMAVHFLACIRMFVADRHFELIIVVKYRGGKRCIDLDRRAFGTSLILTGCTISDSWGLHV